MPDIITLLKADHKEVKTLLKQLTAEEESENCDELFERLYASVKAHAKFEEEEVYPLLKQDEDTKDLALEAYEEHRQVMVLLEALHEMEDDDETCNAKMSVLSENLNHHIKEEESELLPQLKKTVSSEILDELGKSYLKIKNGATSDAERGKSPVKATHKEARSQKGATRSS